MPAAYSKEIVCLANSRKTGGRCVAGKERSTGVWIRPISARITAEVNFDERQYENGQEPQVMDIIEIPLTAAAPHGHQQENHVIDADCYWVRRGRASWGELNDLADHPDAIWANGYSTAAGHNDRLPSADALRYRNSLFLIKPQHAAISVDTPGAAFGNHKKAVRANFIYKGDKYGMKVTDFDVERTYLAKNVGVYALAQPSSLCISLTEAHTDGYCYKLVATVLTATTL